MDDAVLLTACGMTTYVTVDHLVHDEETHPLAVLDPHDISDLLDGTARWERKSVPRERRFWERIARELSSRSFFTLFRCRYEVLPYLLRHRDTVEREEPPKPPTSGVRQDAVPPELSN